MFLAKPCRTFLNSDSPVLPCIQIDEAITALRADGASVMLGPLLSGSYDLMRLKGFHPKSFSNMAKHTPAGFTATCERATQIGLPVHVPHEWNDMDEAEDFRRLKVEFDGQPSPVR